MEVRKFQAERYNELSDFKVKYAELQLKYANALLEAIGSSTPETHDTLVAKVLSVNTELSDLVKDMVESVSKGTAQVDSTTLNDLTSKLIKYQTDYKDIQESDDTLKTLTIIKNSTEQNLANAEWMYNIYISGLIILIIFVIFLVFVTPYYSVFSRTFTSINTVRVI
jgi:DNA repair exonuclease SbcCD ATPase subunit